jgi:hypothetical protein
MQASFTLPDYSVHRIDALGDNAIKQFPSFMRSIHEYASLLEPDLPLGSIYAYGVTMTEEERIESQARRRATTIAAIQDNEARAAAEATPFVYVPTVFPTEPAAPPATASALTIEKWKQELLNFKSYRRGIKTLLGTILSTVGSTRLTALRNLPGGIVELTVQGLLTYLREDCGTPTEASIISIMSDIDSTITSELSFHAEATTKNQLFTFLSDAGQGLSEAQKLHILDKSVSHLGSIVQALAHYRQTVTVLSNRSYGAAIAHIMLHKDSFAQTVADAGYAGHAFNKSFNPPADFWETILTRLSSVSAVSSSKPNLIKHKPDKNKPTKGKVPRSTVWCSYHKVASHSDAECRAQNNELVED